MVDDEENGEFVIVLDEELDPNSTISTSVCKVSEIPLGAFGLIGASDATTFPSLAYSDAIKARTSASVAVSSYTSSAALITC